MVKIGYLKVGKVRVVHGTHTQPPHGVLGSWEMGLNKPGSREHKDYKTREQEAWKQKNNRIHNTNTVVLY